MIRILLVALLALAPLAARAQTEQQALVDRSTLTVQEIFSDNNSSDVLSLLRRSKAALICPQVFKAGFIIGGSGRRLRADRARPRQGWSSPAFYAIGSGSFGLQVGVQDSEIVLMILTEKGLHAVLDSQFKIGADASIAVAAFGAGIEGATTAALRADIVSFARTRGLFAGISLQGSLISSRSELEPGLLRPPARGAADRARPRRRQPRQRAVARHAGQVQRVAPASGLAQAPAASPGRRGALGLRPHVGPGAVLESQAARGDERRGVGIALRRLRPLLPAQAAP